jgi:hypothetical protein
LIASDTAESSFSLVVCDRLIEIRCSGPHARRLFKDGYGQMAVTLSAADPEMCYFIDHEAGSENFRIIRDGEPPLLAYDDSEFLFLFEKDMTIELQRKRADLYFLHAAVVERQGRTALISAPSGTGKSTLTLALLHGGFRYLSDELAPVEPETLRVHPYPHALCLKAEPPAPYRLPAGTLRTVRTLHVPADQLPAETVMTPQPLSAIFFIRRDNVPGGSGGRRLGGAEVAARLYTNTLNALAHPGEGLETAIRIAQRIPGYELDSSDLNAAVVVIREVLATASIP